MDRKNTTKQSDDDAQDRKPAAQPSVPEWRSVAMLPPASEIGSSVPRPMSVGGATFRRAPDIIDKESYFAAATQPQIKAPPSASLKNDSSIGARSNWSPRSLRPVPAFYPLDRSSRFVEDVLPVVVARVSEANRLLSIHAVYCNETATASMITAENVEMHLALWKTSKQEGIVIEIQRRKGDSIAFHRYSRCILDAAAGDLDIHAHVERNGADLDMVYSKNVHRLLTLDSTDESTSESENAIIAIEIAHGLLMKDRMDARQLGLESLCLLTDPKKTGATTALTASRVVLLGTALDEDSSTPEEGLMFDEAPFQEIRQTILSLIQYRRIGEVDEFDDHEAETEEEEHITVLHNLALAVLANALDVIENEDLMANSVPEDAPLRARANTTESISERFLEDAQEFSENNEILKTLISELGKANAKPHNACLSAKCIGSLCRASDKARSRAKELGAKTVVQTALDVGTKTHLKLEKECDKVLKTLNNTTTEN